MIYFFLILIGLLSSFSASAQEIETNNKERYAYRVANEIVGLIIEQEGVEDYVAYEIDRIKKNVIVKLRCLNEKDREYIFSNIELGHLIRLMNKNGFVPYLMKKFTESELQVLYQMAEEDMFSYLADKSKSTADMSKTQLTLMFEFATSNIAVKMQHSKKELENLINEKAETIVFDVMKDARDKAKEVLKAKNISLRNCST